MVDRTVYPDKDKVPELALRQIFGRQKLPESLCLLMADKGMLLVERMAMLGDSIASVKATLKAIVGDDTKFGAHAPAQELSLTLLTAVWKSASVLQEHISARRAKMEEDPSKIPEIPGEDHAEFREIFVTQHPDMILTYMREPHRKFVERIHRDYLVHGAVAFYEVAEMCTRADRIVQTSGFSKTSDDLLRVVQSDNKVAIASDSDVMDRLHAFFIALEYARSTAELEKFRQADHEASTPTKRPRSRSPPVVPTPPKSETRSRKNKARRERNKALRRLARIAKRRERSRFQRAVPRLSSPRRPNAINVCRKRSGRRSCPLPTLALAGAPSTTALSAVGLVINAAISIFAFSAGAITPGTTTIERLTACRGTLVWVPRRQLLTDRRGIYPIYPHCRPLLSRLLRRMTLALSSRQSLSSVLLRLGSAGRKSLATRI